MVVDCRLAPGQASKQVVEDPTDIESLETSDPRDRPAESENMSVNDKFELEDDYNDNNDSNSELEDGTNGDGDEDEDEDEDEN